ncbi:hypothetical protein C475_19673 [Halosimplex carlsbadense 2-9-1]|uniref:Uncharacterized protein n=1 Tax=Halosimplex carlsbadense 2-9-1 TaxID=797114 RepID=M0CER1_9EURY|nr:helix-turn-helix domain-containing protein [Halosimplex carlsbadense]ELZ20852.1 hypothetical protein C475_19673 [Halosimplex carlsbadense 2-9-1]
MPPTPHRADGDLVRDLRSVTMVLEDAQLARLYTYLARDGDATVQNVMADLDFTRSTAYSYVDRLVDAGVVAVTDDRLPKRYSAREVDLTVSTSAGDRAYTITPALIDAVGRRETDDTIDAYVDNHGVAGLATALSHAVAREREEVTHQQLADALEIPRSTAETILQALAPVVDDHDGIEAMDPSLGAAAVEDSPASGE